MNFGKPDHVMTLIGGAGWILHKNVPKSEVDLSFGNVNKKTCFRLKRSQQQKDPSATHSLTTLRTSLDIFWSVTQETSNTNFPSLVALIISFQYRSCSHCIQPFFANVPPKPAKNTHLRISVFSPSFAF